MVANTSIHLVPPPVKPFDQTTAFVEGDTLLIEVDGKQDVVTVGRVHVYFLTLPDGREFRQVDYTLRLHDVHPPFLGCSKIVGEKALTRAFKSYVWVR